MESEQNGIDEGTNRQEQKMDVQSFARLELERARLELRGEMEAEMKTQVGAITAQNWRHLKIVVLVLSVLGLLNIAYVGNLARSAFNHVTATMTQMLSNRISQEFEQPKIRATVEGVASEHAARMLQEQIEPAVEASKAEMKQQSDTAKEETRRSLADFKEFISRSEEEHHKDYSSVSEQVRLLNKKIEQASTLIAALEQRSKIYDLGDKAISEASGAAYDELVKIMHSDPKLRELARTEIFKIKAFFLSLTRLGSIKDLSDLKWEGKQINHGTLTPCDLIFLSHAEPWQLRLMSLKALRRKYLFTARSPRTGAGARGALAGRRRCV